MRNPIKSVMGVDSFYTLAKKLIANHPAACQTLGVKGGNTQRLMECTSLETKLGELDRGKSLLWWSKRPDLTKCLVEYLGIHHDDLGLNQLQGPHMFKFVDAPDLPDLDLRRQEHWIIAMPRFMPRAGTNNNLDYPTRAAMGFWLSEHNSAPASLRMEWLHVRDDLEFELLTRRLKALGNNNLLSCQTLREVFSDDQSVSHLLSQKPLIISVQERMDAGDLYKLIDKRNEAPLLVISRFSLPAAEKESSNVEADYRGKINAWDWVFLGDWRWLLLKWFGQRLSGPEADTYFAEQAVYEWLFELDPKCQWLRSTRDVLRLSQLFSRLSEKSLKKLPRVGLGRALLDLLFKPKESGRDILKPLIEARWKRSDISLEGDLSPETWRELSEGICDYEKLRANMLITNNPGGLDFKHPIVVRLILRDLLIDQIAKKPTQEWASACFDSERRLIVDAALDASSMGDLVKVARSLEKEQDAVVEIGVAEALFTAIGHRISRYLSKDESIVNLIPEDVKRLIVNKVLAGLDLSQELARPWSRPLNSKSDEIEWVSACWSWSLLLLPTGISVPNTWLFPGWSPQLPDQLPQWSQPRPQFQEDGRLEDAHRSGYAENWNFIDIVEQWLSACHGVQATAKIKDLPMFLKIALLRQAAKGLCQVDATWWTGVFGTPWAEAAVLRDLVSRNKIGSSSVAINWWTSVFAHFQLKSNGVGMPASDRWGKSIPKPSPVFQWLMEQLKTDSVKALDLLDDKTKISLAKNPQSLAKSFKLGLLHLLAQRLPSSSWLDPYQAPGFLMNFGADAVDGVIPFLHDKQLGDQAALILWNWAPASAENLLCHEMHLDINARRNLINNCPPGGVAASIESLQRDKDILNSSELKFWVQLRLPNAGIHAASLLGLIDGYSG